MPARPRSHPDLQLLRQMIVEGAVVEFDSTQSDHKTIKLEERDNCNNLVSNVIISGIPQDSIMIRGDVWPSPDRVFTSEKGARRLADFILVSAQDNTVTAVYIEMKARKELEKNNIIQQLKGVRCLMDYCQSIAKHFFGKEMLNEAHHRYIVINSTNEKRTKRTTKTSTKQESSDLVEKTTLKSYRLFKNARSIPYDKLIH